ncbi:MAG: hypothetical protein WCL12_01780 [Actinomycetes bacterium]
MNRTSRTLICFVIAAVACVTLSSCAESDVNNFSRAGNGTSADSTQIGLRNVLIVSNGSKAALAGAVVNKTDQIDTVTSVSLVDATGKVSNLTNSTLVVGPRGAQYFGAPNPAGNQRPAIAVAFKGQPGGLVKLLFTFTKSGDVAIEVPVVPALGEYTATLAGAK